MTTTALALANHHNVTGWWQQAECLASCQRHFVTCMRPCPAVTQSHTSTKSLTPTKHISQALSCLCLDRWWQQADSPWQLLAICYDLQAALSSGDPESYCSKLPVHQDGSCNGLQHYAALGRDEKGGRAVNLLPVDKPQVRRHPVLSVATCCSDMLVAWLCWDSSLVLKAFQAFTSLLSDLLAFCI